jgi:hypothetical protein
MPERPLPNPYSSLANFCQPPLLRNSLFLRKWIE